MDWKRVAQDFKPDGSLRDLYVRETSRDDWQKVLDAVREQGLRPAFTLDGEPAVLPQCAGSIFDAPREKAAALCLIVGGAKLISHFFVEDEIEFDLDPREIDGRARVEALVGFMALLGRVTGKTVVLTLENAPEAVIFRYEVESDEVVRVEPDLVSGRHGR